MQTFLVSVITLYQKILSPYWPGQCRYTPSCSNYTKEAIEYYGVVMGTLMGIKRILRCQPLGKHGYDPVPKKRSAGNNI
ncbi:MAG: membrane protein insertion efficiency factor YidD [SAR202 cluster bacterium]|nr:membrane protein insertion efficiency factor YidD [SAR202 cluster bacterium]